jgi:hypothetical protein
VNVFLIFPCVLHDRLLNFIILHLIIRNKLTRICQRLQNMGLYFKTKTAGQNSKFYRNRSASLGADRHT